MDDDLIRSALGAGPEADPAPELLQRALAAGVARRRRRLAVTAIASTFVVAVAGIAVATRGGGEEIVGVSSAPSTAIDTSTVPAATTGAPPTVPETTAPSPPTDAATTIPTTAPIGTSAPFVDPSFTPQDGTLTIGSRTVSVVISAPPVASGDAFAARTESGSTQLWSFDGSDASAAATVSVDPCPDEVWCAVPHAYDGRFLWVELGAVVAEDLVTALDPVAVVRVDLATGVIDAVPISAGGLAIFDVLPDGFGGAAVAGNGDEAIRVWRVGPDLVVQDARPVPVATPSAVSARLSDDGRRLAYSWAVPSDNTSAVHVIDLGTDADQQLAEGVGVYPQVLDWSEDESELLVQEAYEGRTMIEVGLDGTVSVPGYEDSCYGLDGRMIVGLWRRGYMDEAAVAGSLAVVRADGSGLDPLSEPLIGWRLVCLGNGGVATTVTEAGADGATTTSETAAVFTLDGERRGMGADVEPVPLRVVGS